MVSIVEMTCSLIKGFCYDQLVLAPHIIQIMQEEETINALAMCYRFVVDFKKEDIALNLLLVFNKYTEESFDPAEAVEIFQYSMKELCNIGSFQNDLKTSE